jgi:hypothetical protein
LGELEGAGDDERVTDHAGVDGARRWRAVEHGVETEVADEQGEAEQRPDRHVTGEEGGQARGLVGEVAGTGGEGSNHWIGGRQHHRHHHRHPGHAEDPQRRHQRQRAIGERVMAHRGTEKLREQQACPREPDARGDRGRHHPPGWCRPHLPIDDGRSHDRGIGRILCGQSV